MIDVLIVNFNCLAYTRGLVIDLFRQSHKDFRITIVDQKSTQSGTREFLSYMESVGTIVVRNRSNMPLNWIWNDFVRSSESDIVCLLNNDMRVPHNFLSDIVEIMCSEPEVAAVMHATNHEDYAHALPTVEYVLFDGHYRQGWDICLLRKYWTEIPRKLEFYGGDTFLFQKIYQQGMKVALATSSPVIHYHRQTKKNNRHIWNRRPKRDSKFYQSLGFEHKLEIPLAYSNYEPTIEWIVEGAVADKRARV